MRSGICGTHPDCSDREKVDSPTSERRAMPAVCQGYVLEEAPESSDETGEVCGVLQLALPRFCLTPFVDGCFELRC